MTMKKLRYQSLFKWRLIVGLVAVMALSGFVWPQVTGRAVEAMKDAAAAGGAEVPQEEDGSDSEEAAAEEEETEGQDSGEGSPEMERFRKAAEILDVKQTMPSAAGYTYGSANRRDPFVSPMTAGPATTGGIEPPVMPGIQGMRVDEVRVVGIIIFPDGKPRAMVMGSDNLGYWLTEGTRLRDGLLLSIDTENNEVIFRQDITDPLAIRPYRDVTRQLYPLEEERKR
jgi:hypothetical protein